MKAFFVKLWTIIKSDLWIKVIALVFAFIVWSYVIAGTNPSRTKTVENVRLTITNTAELEAKGYVLDFDSKRSIPSTVSLSVEAGIDIHKSLGADTLRATLNLADINSAGDTTVIITPSSTISGVTFKSVSPSSLTLHVDELVTRTIPVSAKLEGTAGSDYYVSAPQLATDYVTIRGGKSVLEDIVKAICYVPIDNVTEDVRASYALTLYDGEDNEISESLIEEELPSAVVSLTVLPKKTVPVNMDSVKEAITNIKAGYEVTDVVVEPTEIQIAAPAEILKGINEVRVQAINAMEADTNILIDASVQPLENVEYQSASMVEVLLKISEIQQERTFKNRQIGLENLEEGYSARITSAKYTDVTLSGGQSVVGALRSEDVLAYADLAGLKQGTHAVKVELAEIAGIAAENVTLGTAEVTVLIQRR